MSKKNTVNVVLFISQVTVIVKVIANNTFLVTCDSHKLLLIKSY